MVNRHSRRLLIVSGPELHSRPAADTDQLQQSNAFLAAPMQMGQGQQMSYNFRQYLKAGETPNRLRIRTVANGAPMKDRSGDGKSTSGGRVRAQK